MTKSQLKTILTPHANTIVSFLYSGSFGEEASNAVKFMLENMGQPFNYLWTVYADRNVWRLYQHYVEAAYAETDLL